MDSSSLNQAHREQRRAEACQRGRRLEEAAECHGRAAELLISSLTLSPTSLARESIKLQHNYHLRQQELLRFQSKQIEKYVKALENQRLKMAGSGGASGSGGKDLSSGYTHTGRRSQAISIQMTKNTEKFDSLLSLLIVEEADTKEESIQDPKNSQEGDKGFSTGDKKSPSEPLEDQRAVRGPSTEKETEGEAEKKPHLSGSKKEKDVMMIVEELRTLRDHQADLISQLMFELNNMEKDNLQLKNQVRELQAKCEQYEGERRRLRAMADSSCSPFVFSPLSELSPDPPSVPDLAPLEMPPLDFMENFDKDS